MTKPVKTKTTRLLVSLRDDIERFLDALFGELDRLRLGQITRPGAAPTPAPTRAALAPPSTPAVKPSPTLGTPPPAGAGRYQTEVQAKSQCPADLVVWVNLTSKIYHVAGHKSYGTTKAGAYMCEREATAQGFRAAKTEKHPSRITPRNGHINGSNEENRPADSKFRLVQAGKYRLVGGLGERLSGCVRAPRYTLQLNFGETTA